MSDRRGALLHTLDNGTQIYQHGVFNGSFFIQLNVAVYTFGTDYDFSTGEWSPVTAGFAHSLGNGSALFGVSPDGVGGAGLRGSIKGPYGTSGDLAFVINQDGTFTTVVGAGIGIDQLGLNTGLKMTDQLGGSNPNVSTIYNTVAVNPDGTYTETILISSNKTSYGTGFQQNTYSANGTLLTSDVHDIKDPDMAANLKAGTVDRCFVAGTEIDMWPLDIGTAATHESDVLSHIWHKPIEDIEVGDWVVSFDTEGNLKPSRVSRLFRNDAKIILDFFGTGVTPGHVYLRADGSGRNRFETLIDILRDDGVIETVDKTCIRAATGLSLDDPRDAFVQCVTGEVIDDGAIAIRECGQLRLGTRFITENGCDYCVADLVDAIGATVNGDGLICQGSETPRPFHWDLSDQLPKPEDYVLMRSGTTLEDIYRAAEWEGQRPRLGAPLTLDGGPVESARGVQAFQLSPNTPLAGTDARYAGSNYPSLKRGSLVRPDNGPATASIDLAD